MITDLVQSLQRRKCFHSAFPGTVNILNSCLKDIITEFTLISLKKINTFRRVFKFVDYVLGNPLEIKGFQIFSITNPWSHVPGLIEEYQSMQCIFSAWNSRGVILTILIETKTAVMKDHEHDSFLLSNLICSKLLGKAVCTGVDHINWNLFYFPQNNWLELISEEKCIFCGKISHCQDSFISVLFLYNWIC